MRPPPGGSATAAIAFATTPELRRLGAQERAALLALPPTEAVFRETLARHADLFDRLEVAAPAVPAEPPPAEARIAFWNAERGKFLAPSIALLASLDATALLLCEIDLGMARSGQAHTTRELAAGLDMGYAFAVEFLELDLGDARERAWHAGAVNEVGLHGAAILAPCPLERPALIRLETGGAWFDGRRGERRVGGRIAVVATLVVGGAPVTLASVHLESHSDPAGRAAQLTLLLDAIDRYGGAQPVLIGGDLNSCTIGRDWARGTGEKPQLDAARVLDPVPYEPLFEVATARGYDWRACNTPGVPTQRTRPDGTPAPPLGRIDWFLSRGLVACDPQTVAAVDQNGVALSDHDVLTVSVRPA